MIGNTNEGQVREHFCVQNFSREIIQNFNFVIELWFGEQLNSRGCTNYPSFQTTLWCPYDLGTESWEGRGYEGSYKEGKEREGHRFFHTSEAVIGQTLVENPDSDIRGKAIVAEGSCFDAQVCCCLLPPICRNIFHSDNWICWPTTRDQSEHHRSNLSLGPVDWGPFNRSHSNCTLLPNQPPSILLVRLTISRFGGNETSLERGKKWSNEICFLEIRTRCVSGLRSSFSEPVVMRYHISNEVHYICFHQENLPL